MSTNSHAKFGVVLTIGGFQKISNLYHTMDGFLEFRGQGGFFELEFRRHGGILTSGGGMGEFQIWDFQRV